MTEKQAEYKTGDETAIDGLHDCGGSPPEFPNSCGIAIYECIGDKEGRLWVRNGEYGNQVNYCPWCGFKAKVQVAG
jgi:hypothetical protein